MTGQTLSQIERATDGRHPLRSVLRLLDPHRGRVLAAVGFFALKDTPLWLLPVITAGVIDVVVAGGPLSTLAIWAGIALVALLQNYPNHVMYTRFFMGAVRSIGADLRNALASRLQSLSIGFHSRANSAIVQTKVVRDVENVEVMLQQTAHPLLSATMVLIGAVVICDRKSSVVSLGAPVIALVDYPSQENFSASACPLCAQGVPVTAF